MEVVIWIQEDSLTVEYGKEAPCRYEVVCAPTTGVGSVDRLRTVKSAALHETSFMPSQLGLFDSGEVLGEEGWVKFLKLDKYVPRLPWRPHRSQKPRLPYTQAGHEVGRTFTPTNPLVAENKRALDCGRRIDYVFVRCDDSLHGPTLDDRGRTLAFHETVGGVWVSEHFGVVA